MPSIGKVAITRLLSLFSQNSPDFWRSGRPAGWRSRVLLLLWSLFLVAGFSLAASVSPDPRGFGTHQRFWPGMRPCSFMEYFQIPCPSCGMTTSFAHFVRGQWLSSARANPAGLLLAIVCAVQIPWCWISVRVGRFWMIDEPDLALMWMTLSLAGGSLLQWGARLALG